MARPICFRLLAHLIRLAASRTFWTAGTSRPMRMAMMAITTNSSMRVNAGRRRRECQLMFPLLNKELNEEAPANGGTPGTPRGCAGRHQDHEGCRHCRCLSRGRAGHTTNYLGD